MFDYQSTMSLRIYFIYLFFEKMPSVHFLACFLEHI